MRNSLIGAVLLLVLLAGCGDDDGTTGVTPDDTSGGSTSSADAGAEPDESVEVDAICAFVGDDQIASIVENPVVGVDIDPTLCEYAMATGTPGTDGTAVDVFVAAAADEACDLEFGLVGADSQEEVDGLGSGAFWKAASAQLFVCTGERYVTITQYAPSAVTDEQAFDRARQIAELVLGAL